MQKTYDPLYKLDSKGKLRIWYMEQNDDQYRTFDGLADGTVKASGWSTAFATNVGRSNERNAVEQATAEIEAQYTKKRERTYHDSIEATSNGAHFFEPMLAQTYLDPKKPAAKVGFAPGFAQPKLDGMRAIARRDGLFSRQGKSIPGTQHIQEALAPVFAVLPDLILDGELYNHDLGDDFNELMSLAKKGNPSPERAEQIRTQIQYHVYDIAGGIEKADAPFSIRTDILNDLFQGNEHYDPIACECVVEVETYVVETPEEYDALHTEWLEKGYEGSMLRRDAPYCNKRTYDLLKRKEFDDAEFDIVRIEQGDGNWLGCAKRAVFWLPGADRSEEPNKNNTFEAGLRGSKDKNAALLADAENQKVATVRFFGWTPSAIPKPRFGVVTKFHGAGRVD